MDRQPITLKNITSTQYLTRFFEFITSCKNRDTQGPSNGYVRESLTGEERHLIRRHLFPCPRQISALTNLFALPAYIGPHVSGRLNFD